MSFEHIPVLLDETLELMNIKPGGIYVDGTLGGAGHSSEIIKRAMPGGTLVGIDQDENAIKAASARLEVYGQNVHIVRNNFRNIKSIVEDLGIEKVDGILLDIGVSSHQIDEDERGFSYMNEGPLDMRMDRNSSLTAEVIVNEYKEQEITKILREYGEENWAARIAKFIVEDRKEYRIESTHQLVDIIKRAIPAAARREGGHPAKRTFQALRIAVNDELNVLEEAVKDSVSILNEGGRILVITFHSLEDRIVKTIFNSLERPCTCPPQIPVCVCGKKPEVKVLTRKPITASERELAANARAKSAKLRAAVRISSKES